MVPEPDVLTWWQPSLWAPTSSWETEGGVVVVSKILMEEAPEAVMSSVGVTAREKMSVGCAGGS